MDENRETREGDEGSPEENISVTRAADECESMDSEGSVSRSRISPNLILTRKKIK